MSDDAVEPVDIARAMWALYAVRDVPKFLSFAADGLAYSMFIPQEVLPFGGETIGRAAFSDRIQMVFSQFYTLRYEGMVLGHEGNTVRGQVAYCFKHKATGEAIEGVMRQVFHFEDGKVARLHEFHDVERIRAFVRLVSHVAQE